MQEASEPTRLWYTPEEAKEILHFGRTKMYELLRAGAIKAVKFGGAWRIPASEVDPAVIFNRLAARTTIEGAGVSQR